MVSTLLTFKLDTSAPTAPAAPAEPILVKFADAYLNASEAATSTTIRVPLGNTGAVAGDTVELLLNGASFATAKKLVLSATDITNGYASFAVSSADLGADALKSLTGRVTDAAGNVGAVGSPLEFTKDTGVPTAPVLALGTGVTGGATAAEATQSGGVVTVKAELDSIVSVTFSRTGGGTVTKPVIGAGTATAVAVVLTSGDLTKLGDGLISVSAKATDAAGNMSTAGTTSFTLDTNPPTVLNVVATGTGITSGTGAIKAGTVVTLTLTMSKAVTVTGVPSLSLNSGGTATYTRGSGTTSLVFTYTVGATDSTADLEVTALLTTLGSIADAAGNPLATFSNSPAGTLKIG